MTDGTRIWLNEKGLCNTFRGAHTQVNISILHTGFLIALFLGIYMLRLRGKEIPENSEADQEFLMKIMEKNEEVEEANTEEEIMKLNKEIKEVIMDLQKKLSIAFFDGDLKRVVKLLTYMKYYTSIDSQIQAAIRNKGIIR